MAIEFVNDISSKFSKASNWFREGVDSVNDFLSETIGDPMGAAVGGAHTPEPDPTLKTADPNEKELRTRIEFSDIVFSFPTTAGISGRYGRLARVKFPAYITTFGDSFSPSWKNTSVFGRADPIPSYSNTTRTVQLGVLIPCYNKVDANENMKKLNMLIKNLYPGYQELQYQTRVLDSPPLVRIKFANLLINHKNPAKGLLGYITSFSTDMALRERGMFLAKDQATGYIFPKAIGFTLSFSPLHESTVGWNSSQMEAEFFGNNNFPYNAINKVGEVAAQSDPKVGLGQEQTEEDILSGDR